MTQSESFSNSSYTDQTHLAERELSAFIAAVAELFGTDQARMSAEDWLDESRLIDVSPRSAARDWRAITIAASVRLANRLNVALHCQRSLGASTTGTQVSSIPSSNSFDTTIVS
jgi:hypothetical protein